MRRNTIRRGLKLAALAAVVVIAFASCDLLAGIGIEARISAFEDDLNQEDRSDVFENFSESKTENYENLKSATQWDAGFTSFENAPFTITVIDSSDPRNVTATFSHTNDPTGQAATFKMVSDGMDWYIEEFWLDALSDTVFRGL